MLKENIYGDLLTLLKQHGELFAENGSLLKNKAQELALKNDPKLIELLLSSPKFKPMFFFDVSGATIFNKDKFIELIYNKEFLPDSYTKYSQKIGLSSGGDFITKNKEVVLNWPYKDCTLEGGMTTEEKGRDEIFWNEVIAPEQITRLREPKAFMNAKRMNGKSSKKFTDFKRDKTGTIKDNLIIKGNNLLALYSLKEQFAGKIKLIYIDPPYNTGGEANIFSYNNSFNHSTWLVFMKNRLEIAKQLLREDGFIAIAIDHYELFYLGTLADEVFGRDNRLGIITVVHKPEGRQTTDFFNPTNEFMLVYSRRKEIAKFRQIAIDDEIRKTFDKDDKDGKGKYKLKPYLNNDMMDRVSKENKPKFWYPIYVSKDLGEITLDHKEGYYSVLPITDNNQKKTWQTIKKSTQQRIDNNEIIAIKNKEDKVELFYKFREQQRFKTHWIDKKYNSTAKGTNLLSKIINRKKAFSYPKSIHTVLDTLKIMTNKDDIILDFFAGSGTAGHALLKLNKEDGGNRQFILVEQLQKHIDVCVERLQKVIEQEFLPEIIISGGGGASMTLSIWSWLNGIRDGCLR